MAYCIMCRRQYESEICISCFIELEGEIGRCSEIISIATRIQNPTLKNSIMKHVGDYRQKIRMVADE